MDLELGVIGADIDAVLEFLLGYNMGGRSATRAASLARSAAVADGTHHTNRIEDLNERIDRLSLVVRAMWAVLEDQGYTAEELRSKLEALDLEDGVLDGQSREKVGECHSCQSKVAIGLVNCQFCGTEVRAGNTHPLGLA